MWGANHHSLMAQAMIIGREKMKMYLGSINDQVWDVTENDYAIIDPDNPTKIGPTNNATQWRSTPYTMPLIQRCLSKSRIVKEQMKCGGDWRKSMRAHWR